MNAIRIFVLTIACTAMAVPAVAAAQYDDIVRDIAYLDLPPRVQAELQRFTRCIHDRVQSLNVKTDRHFCGAEVFNVEAKDIPVLKNCYVRENLARIGRSSHRDAWQYQFEYACFYGLRFGRTGIRCPSGAEFARTHDDHDFACEYRGFNILMDASPRGAVVVSFGKPIV